MGTRGRNAGTDRNDDLRRMLEERRQQLTGQLREQMRDVRSAGGARTSPQEDDRSEEDTQADIHLALMQMASETLRAIDSALRRLEQGKYGNCAACGRPIAQERLRAMPCAVRCKKCEEAREANARRRPAPGTRRDYEAMFDGALE